VLITVPDGRIRSVAERLAHSGLPQVPVLHTSGVLGPEPLEPLQQRHFPVGSLHPLVSIADPARDAHKLHGAWYGVEGMPAALEVARAIVDALHGRLIRIDPRGKPLYHAAAVFASNYAVALLAVAERVMREAGVEPELARDALTGLAAGAVQNVAAAGPVDALTGPIARGDDETVSLHLARLSGEDRPLYSVLARETLLLARARGLSLLWLTVNKGNPSVQVYRRLGFRIAADLMMDIGGGFVMDDYRMEKTLQVPLKPE